MNQSVGTDLDGANGGTSTGFEVTAPKSGPGSDQNLLAAADAGDAKVVLAGRIIAEGQGDQVEAHIAWMLAFLPAGEEFSAERGGTAAGAIGADAQAAGSDHGDGGGQDIVARVATQANEAATGAEISRLVLPGTAEFAVGKEPSLCFELGRSCGFPGCEEGANRTK
jgi:hypothetical protein